MRRSSSAAIAAASIVVRAQQQLRAEIGPADAAAGIDARAEHKAEVPRLAAGRVSRATSISAVRPTRSRRRMRDQALGDEGAIEPIERHHVGDGAERDEVEEVEQIRLAAEPRSRSRAAATRG